MKLIATLSLLLLAGATYGQAPTLTGATNNPQAGESFVGIEAPQVVSPGAAGANVTWDFSALTHSEFTDTTNYVSCSSAPACGYFSGSNLAVSTSSNVNSYEYLAATGSSLSTLGYADNSGDTVHSINNVAMQYPFTYNSNFTANYSIYTLSNTQSEYEYGSSTTTGDAYGTLITPAGTYQNVLRAYTITYNTDSIIEFSNTYISHDTEEVYDWYIPGFHTALAEIDIERSANTPDTTVSYTVLASTAVGNIANAQNDFSIYPNPAKELLNIKFSVAANQQVTVTIQDVLGRQIAVVANDTYPQGQHELSYNTSALPKGLYLVQLRNGAVNTTRKLEIL